MMTQAELMRRRREMRRRIRLALVQRRVSAAQPRGDGPPARTGSEAGAEPAPQHRLAGPDEGDVDPLRS